MSERIGCMIRRKKDFTLEEIFLEELNSKKNTPSFVLQIELMLLITVKANICIL